MEGNYLLSILAIVIIVFIAGGVYLVAQKRGRAPGERVQGPGSAGRKSEIPPR